MKHQCGVCGGTFSDFAYLVLVPHDALCEACYIWAKHLHAVKPGNYFMLMRSSSRS